MREITSLQAWNFLRNKHYSGRKPNICVAYGWFIENSLVAVCTFGKPVSRFLCEEICGKEHSSNVFELNRLCRVEDLKEPLSKFVAWCLRQLKSKNWIIVSYSDTSMHHTGYIYQACNFIYTGKTKERTDIYSGYNKHSRHYGSNLSNVRVVRSSKHRYVYFATNSKRLRKELIVKLKYDVLPYPKDENQNYVLGEFQKPTLVGDVDNYEEIKYQKAKIIIE